MRRTIEEDFAHFVQHSPLDWIVTAIEHAESHGWTTCLDMLRAEVMRRTEVSA